MPRFIGRGTISGLGEFEPSRRGISPALGPYAVAQAVSDGLYGALLCRPHPRGIFGRDRYRALDAEALSQATQDGPSGLQPKKNDRRNRVERRPKFREEGRQGAPLEEGTFRASWTPCDSLFHSSVHNNNQKLNLPAGLSRPVSQRVSDGVRKPVNMRKK